MFLNCIFIVSPGSVPSGQEGARRLLEDLQLHLHRLPGRPHRPLPTSLQRREEHVRPLWAGLCLVNTKSMSPPLSPPSILTLHCRLFLGFRTESVFILVTVCVGLPEATQSNRGTFGLCFTPRYWPRIENEHVIRRNKKKGHCRVWMYFFIFTLFECLL